MYKRDVCIQNLMNLTKKEGRIDEFELVAEAEQLYRCLKIQGVKNTQVSYEEKGEIKIKYATEISEYTRAIAAFIMILIYRWNDMTTGRLEAHYGLQLRIDVILGDVKIFRNSHAGLECISVKDFIDAYMNK